MKIKAAVVREKGGPFKIEDIELDEPRDNEVMVRMVGSGSGLLGIIAQSCGYWTIRDE